MPRLTKSQKTTAEKEIIKAGQKEIFQGFLKDPTIQRAYAKILIESGLNQYRVAEVSGLSINKIRDLKNDTEDTESNLMLNTLRDLEISRLHYISANLLSELEKPDKLAAMKGGDIAYTYKTILETRRLLENKSTSNIAVVIQSLNKRMDDEAQDIEKVLKTISEKNPKITREVDKENAISGNV